jgi:hypothetical protein
LTDYGQHLPKTSLQNRLNTTVRRSDWECLKGKLPWKSFNTTSSMASVMKLEDTCPVEHTNTSPSSSVDAVRKRWVLCLRGVQEGQRDQWYRLADSFGRQVLAATVGGEPKVTVWQFVRPFSSQRRMLRSAAGWVGG